MSAKTAKKPGRKSARKAASVKNRKTVQLSRPSAGVSKDMGIAAKKSGRKAAPVKNRNSIQLSGPSAGISLGQRISRANRYRQNYNPLIGLTLVRARTLIESYARGEFADLMWTFGAPFLGIECADPDLLALIERRSAALQDFTWHARIVDKAKRRSDFEKNLAAEQQAAIYEHYDAIDNLEDSIDHLALASFRGFSHLQKHRRPDGDIHHLEILDQWNVVRDGWNGDWKYNPEASQVSFESLPPEHLIEAPSWIIRENARPINRIALTKVIRAGLADKDWDAFIETYGLPGGIVIGPPNVPTDKEDEFRDAAEQAAEGNSGYLPYGSTYTANDAPRGINPFRDRLDQLSEKLILAGTGGLLTMLSMPTGIGSGSTDAHENAFRQIAKKEAKSISSVFQREIDEEIFGKDFRGRPRLAYFEIAADEETDPGDAVGHIVSLAGSGYITDPAQVQELTRYNVTREKAETGNLKPEKGAFLNRGPQEKKKLDEFFQATASDLVPVSQRLKHLLTLRGAAFEREAKALRSDLPALLESINSDPASAEILAEIFGEELLEGLSL